MSELPEGALLKVELEIRLPKAASEDDIRTWLRHTLLQSGGIAYSNPLFDCHPESFGTQGFDWEWSGYVGRSERINVQKLPSGGEQYQVRYIREQSP